jgi:anti-sigma regulatory factor (Ser/Thr protein kinase)
LNEAVLWILVGALSTLLGMGIFYLARRWHHQWRYGTPIAHEEQLVAYGRQIAGLLDREAIGRVLAVDVPQALDVSRAVVLLSEGHNLVATGDVTLRLPVHHAAVRWVASGGEAMGVGGRLRELIAQGSADLTWTAAWVPLMRGADLYGVWLLGERLDAQSPAPIHIEIAAEALNVPEETALAIYRIAQEALQNAIQHADASEIAVRLTQYPDRLRMTVTDDGRGIAGASDLRRFVAEGHFGLAGMRERAAMIGGHLEVQSAVDYGTVVILEVPAEE